MSKDFFQRLSEKLKKNPFSILDRTGYKLVDSQSHQKPVDVLPVEDGVVVVFDEFTGDVVRFKVGKGMKIKIDGGVSKSHS